LAGGKPAPVRDRRTWPGMRLGFERAREDARESRLAYTRPVEAENHAAEALAWARYAALRDRRRGVERVAERAAAIGALVNELGAEVEGEPGLGYSFAEVIRAFVTFSNQLVSAADGVGGLAAEAEREWRSALERLPARERADLEARRLTDPGP